jgi:hypothetical protein
MNKYLLAIVGLVLVIAAWLFCRFDYGVQNGDSFTVVDAKLIGTGYWQRDANHRDRGSVIMTYHNKRDDWFHVCMELRDEEWVVVDTTYTPKWERTARDWFIQRRLPCTIRGAHR